MKVACPLQLEREHEGYRRMVEAFEDSAMVLLGLDGKIESWNAGAARITQYDAEDAVGGNYSMLYTAEARAAGEAAQDLARALRDGQYERDCLQGRKNGAVYRARVRISLLKDKHSFHRVCDRHTRSDRTRRGRSALRRDRAHFRRCHHLDG
jgi:PAS domain S-box-containing protein